MSGISTDSHYSHLAWVNQPRKQGGLGGLDYPLVSDFNKNISRDYGVLIEEAGIALRGQLKIIKVKDEPSFRLQNFEYLSLFVHIEDGGQDADVMTISGLFIIDPEGVVRQMSINDLPVGRSVDETLRLIKAFQFVEKHGEVRHWPLIGQ